MSKPLRAEVSVEIGRPVGEIFTALCEASSWPAWTRWARHVTVEPPGPIRGGSELQIVKRGAAIRRLRRWLVTDLRPDRLIALEDEGGSHRFWLHLEPARESTTVTARVQLPKRGLIPFLRRRSEESALRADLRRLKAILEAPAGVAALLPSRPTVLDPDALAITSLEGARRTR